VKDDFDALAGASAGVGIADVGFEDFDAVGDLLGFSRRPLEKSSRMRTRRPSARRARTRAEPMKPAPPVTRSRGGMGESLSERRYL